MDPPPPPPTTAEQPPISKEATTLQDLAIRGSWKTIIDKTTHLLSSPQPPPPLHDQLVFLTFNTIALTKLRRYSDALAAIDSFLHHHSATSFDSPPFLHHSASMVPFSLRWLHSLLPSLLRPSSSLDRLYLLLSFVRHRLSSSSSAVWRRRENLVIGTLISIHSSHKEFAVCLSLLHETLARDPNDANLLSKLGYVQLQFGDLEGAKSSFHLAEKALTSSSSVSDRNLIGRNKALVYLVAKDYVSAVREYDECIERDGADAVAINNKALCLMYLRDLGDSIKVLESSLERVPTVALNETMVMNLCSMYELAFVNHSDLKKTLNSWIARVAPDDFDASCTRV